MGRCDREEAPSCYPACNGAKYLLFSLAEGAGEGSRFRWAHKTTPVLEKSRSVFASRWHTCFCFLDMHTTPAKLLASASGPLSNDDQTGEVGEVHVTRFTC